MDLKSILEKLESGQLDVDTALGLLNKPSEDNLGFARVDLDRVRRRGTPEVVFGLGKSADQIGQIICSLWREGQTCLATRVESDIAETVINQCAQVPLIYDELARCLYTEADVVDRGVGRILVISAGTSDLPVAAEAMITARLDGNHVDGLTDVGVAGLHRLLNHLDQIRSANVIIVCAGMEGALPSVVAGLVSRPVIAVPTSIGYGANFKGLTALLGMLNSCAAGVTVVNIDNGFGAGYAASSINRRASDD
ncbi:MAG: 1-(5-phosphoribosyl)-5-amino-4-imidazole-carboxylate carboxylase [Myxococcales bacterium]|nr:1-(5-phosphoribosyl)-5-amino-4-imidazole-carboxylate carboxylase [Myxococcales bacterium]